MSRNQQQTQRQRGGGSTEGSRNPLYYSPAWRALRLEALERDGYRCVICGIDVSGYKAAIVDHVEPVESHPHLALELTNLRTLCRLHDAQAHRERAAGKGGPRRERFTVPGCDANGMPLDPAHPWNQAARGADTATTPVAPPPPALTTPSPSPAAPLGEAKARPSRDLNNFGKGKDGWSF